MNLFDLFARISLDTSEYDKGIGEAGKTAAALGGKLKSGLATAGKVTAAGIGLIAGAATAAGGALLALEASTEEYRVAQGKLNTAFEAAGYSAETAKTSYNEFYKILGDTDTATEASQLLAKLARSEEDVTKWTRIAAGVSGTFGDSLPIEALIESANETAKVGQVTGNLADALNWAGISEDKFNEKLEKAKTEAERNQIIMETLATTYNGAADAFYKNNEAIVASRNAQAQMDESLAKLGETVSGIKNRVIGDFLPAIAQITESLAGMLSSTEGADEKFSESLSGLISKATEKLPQFTEFGTQILLALVNGIVLSLPALAESIPTILQSMYTAFTELAPTMLQVGAQLLSQLAQGILLALPMIGTTVFTMLTQFGTYIQENLPTLIEQGLQFVVALTEGIRENAGLIVDGALSLITSLAQGLMDGLPAFIENAPTIVSNLAGAINDNAPKILTAGVQLLVTVGKGLINAIPTFIANIPAIISAAVNAFLAFNWLNLGSSLIKSVSGGIGSAVGFVQTSINNIVNAVKSGFKNLPAQLKTIGSNIIRGLWNGISSMTNWVKDKIMSLAGSVVGWAKEALGIKSPSRVFRDEVGKYVGLGLAMGIEDSTDEAVKAADNLAKSVYDKSKKWLDKQVKYQDYSLRQQLEVWDAIQSQFVSNSQQYADAEEQILDIRHKILQENLDLEETYQKQLSDVTKDIFDSYKLFDEVPEAQKASGDELIANLQNQITSIESFYAGLDELYSRGVGADLVSEIADMGVKASDELSALLNLSDEKLSEYSDLYEQKQKLANDLALEQLAELRTKTDEEIQANLDAINGKYETEAPAVGQALPDGMARGILAGQSGVINAAVRVATAAIRAAKDTLGVHSPSTVFKDIGKNMALGLSIGYENEYGRVKSSIEDGMNFGTASVDFASSGLGIASAGMVNGITSATQNGGSYTFNLMLPDNTKLASYLLKPLANYAQANGTPILNPT